MRLNTMIAATVLLMQALPVGAKQAPAPVPDPSTWTSSVDAARYLPCREWQRMPNGGWNYPGTMHIGSSTITNITFGSYGREAAILSQRCAAAKK
jgi:hypothetical protein